MSEDRITKALRPSSKEIDAHRIEIECVEPPGGRDEGYIVNVCPKSKSNEPGKSTKSIGEYTNPIKRVFESKEAVLAYLKKVL